jgi:hypothetical protein
MVVLERVIGTGSACLGRSILPRYQYLHFVFALKAQGAKTRLCY